MWWLLLWLPVAFAACDVPNTTDFEAVHRIVERAQMMQGTYHVLDALEEYSWKYEKTWTGTGFPSADDPSPHIVQQLGPQISYDVFSLTRARFTSQEEGNIYCTKENDPAVCIGTEPRGTSLVATRYYGLDFETPVETSNATYKLILGPIHYTVHVRWDLDAVGANVDVNMRVWTLQVGNTGGIRLIFNTVSGEGSVYTSTTAFRNYLVGQTLMDTHLYRSGTCGDDASTTCPGAIASYNVPCAGRGRCETSCQCICDKAPHEMIMEALVVGGSAPNTPDGTLTLENNPLRTPYRGAGCEITCPGYDGFSMESICSGRGTCGDKGQCICDYGYIGNNCQFTCPGFDNGAERICSKKGSCEITDISPTSFRSSDTRNRDRFMRTLRIFYARCHTFSPGNRDRFNGETCTTDSDCESLHCDGTCQGDTEPEHVYVALPLTFDEPAQSTPIDPKQWCTYHDTCVAYDENGVYESLDAQPGSSLVWVKDPFLRANLTSTIMKGRESYNKACAVPSQKFGEREWVWRPFTTLEQRYDEPQDTLRVEGLLTRPGITDIVDDNPPTLVATRRCEIHPNFVLRCPSCLCFSSRVQGFFDGPMCEQCQRGYATETCKAKCPGYDGKNIATACSGLGLCNMGKDGTGECLCGGRGGSASTAAPDRFLPIYRDVDAPYGGGTASYCALLSEEQCEYEMGCQWSRRCVPKRTGGERAVPSPALLPFEPTYFFGQYREFSTFLWPTGNTEAINLVTWSEDGTRDQDGTIVCRDFPGVQCAPEYEHPFGAGLYSTLQMCPKDSVDLNLLALLEDPPTRHMQPLGVEECDGERLTAEECEAYATEHGVAYGGASAWLNDVAGCFLEGSTVYYNTNLEILPGATSTSNDRLICKPPRASAIFKACCRCGGGQRAHGLPTSALKVASSYEPSCVDTWLHDCNAFAYCSDGRLQTPFAIEFTRDRNGVTPDQGCCSCGGGQPDATPAPCRIPEYARDVDRECDASYTASYDTLDACEISCSVDMSCFAYQWDGNACKHSLSGLQGPSSVGTICYRKENHERCAGWGCANMVGVDCASCENPGAREGCCSCGGGVDSNAPLVPFNVRPNPRTTDGSFPVSVSQKERRTASKINFPFEFAGVQTIRSKRRIGTNICPDCPDADCNKCPNDCALCVEGYSAFNCGDLCGTCIMGGVCVSKPADGVTLCDCPSSSSSSRHNCCPKGFVLLTNDQTLTRPTQIGGIAAGLATYGAFSSDADPRSVNYFNGGEISNIVSGCYPCPGIVEAAEICLHPFCEDSLVDVPDRCRTDTQYRVGFANLWKTRTPKSWIFHFRRTCVAHSNTQVYNTFQEASNACDESCYGVAGLNTFTLCSGLDSGDDKNSMVWQKSSLGTCVDAAPEDTLEMQHWRSVYAASAGYASNACHGDLDQCMVDFNAGGSVFEDRTVCGRCLRANVDVTLSHGRDCEPCGYGEFGELPTGESFSTTCQSCPTGRGVPGFVGVKQLYARSESAPCASGITSELECNEDASCLCYTSDATYTKYGFHKAPGYACEGSASWGACPASFDAFGCYMRVGNSCATFVGTSIVISSNHTAWVNSAMTGGPCQSCPVGRFNDGTSAMCQTCGKGTYQDEDGMLGCKACPFGWYTERGSGVEGHDEASDCESCAAGQYMEVRFTDENACKVCPVGFGTTGDDRWYCEQCVAGQYQFRALYDWNSYDSSGALAIPSNDCTACVPGRYQNQDGAQTCKRCSSGLYQNEFSQIGCKTCAHGQIPDSERVNCTDCPGGYVAAAPTSFCSICSAGKYSEGGTAGGSTCKDCSAGTYNPGAAASACLECLPGAYMDELGSAYNCKQCQAGKYGDENALTVCKACPASKPGSSVGSISQLNCKVCEAGRSVGSSGCDACAVGTYQDQTNQATCKYCPGVEQYGISQPIVPPTYTAFNYQSEMSAMLGGSVYTGPFNANYLTQLQISNYNYVWDLSYLSTYRVSVPCDPLCCYVDYYYAHSSCTDSTYEEYCQEAPSSFAFCCQNPNTNQCSSFCQNDPFCTSEPACSGPYAPTPACTDPPTVPTRYAHIYTPFIYSQYELFGFSDVSLYRANVNIVIYPVDGYILNQNCGISPSASYTYASTYTEQVTVPVLYSESGSESTFTIAFTSREDREFKCMSLVGTLSHGYSAYDSINDIVHCYIYPSEESLPCLTFLTADADGRTYFNYNKYESQFSNVFYSFGSLQASTSEEDCGCKQDEWMYSSVGTCKKCPSGKLNAPTYHRQDPSACADATTTRFRVGCERDGNSQYSGSMSFTGNSQSYDLNNVICGSGGDGNQNKANDRINRILYLSPKHNHKVTVEIYGESNCQQSKSSFTIGCGSTAPSVAYFQIDSSVYSTSRPGYDGSKFDASCLRFTLEACP